MRVGYYPILIFYFNTIYMKIRIGNDIKLDVYLSKDNIKDTINIKSVQCYLINTTQSSYPACQSTSYDINTCGLPKYHIMPCEKRVDNYFWRCDNYWIKAPYDGFGVNPEWDSVYIKNHHPLFFTNKYLAESHSTPESNRIEVIFPALDQRTIGVYDLLIIAQIYEPGYNDNNTKTISVDYGNVFELVSHSNEADVNDNTTITVGYSSDSDATDIKIIEPNITKVFVGNVGFVTAQAIPVNSKNNKLQWEIEDKHFSLESGDGNVMRFKGISVEDPTNPIYTAKAKVFLVNNPDVYKEVEITTTNYAQRLGVGASIPSGSSVYYNDEILINAFVVTQNGCNVFDYFLNDQWNYAVQFNEVVNQYVVIDRLEDGTISIINKNTSSSDVEFTLTLTSVIPTQNGEYPTRYVRYTLKPMTSTQQTDDYTVSGKYNEDNNSIDLTRRYGENVQIDVSNLDKINWKVY